MTASTTKILPRVNHLRLHSCINPHTKITANKIIQKLPPNDHHRTRLYYVSLQSYAHHSLIQDTIYYFIHNNPRTNSSHFTSSCPIIGTVFYNLVEAPYYIFGQTPLNGNSGNTSTPFG